MVPAITALLCIHYLVASTIISINLPLFLRTEHPQIEIAQNYKLLFLVVHQNAALLRKKAVSILAPAASIWFQSRAAFSAGRLPFT